MKKPNYARDRVLRHRREHQNYSRRHKPHRRVRTQAAMKAAQERSKGEDDRAMEAVKAILGTFSMRRFFAGKKLDGLKGHRQSRGKDRRH